MTAGRLHLHLSSASSPPPEPDGPSGAAGRRQSPRLVAVTRDGAAGRDLLLPVDHLALPTRSGTASGALRLSESGSGGG